MNRPMRLLLLLLVTTAVTLRLAGPAAAQYAQIEGSGSTWSYTIVQQWISDVNASGMRITFNNNGSSQGRKDFANNVTDFGITEIPYQGADPVTNEVDKSNRPYAYLPIVAGGTAFTYHINVGGKLYDNLRLSGETITKIFTNKITNWNDPAITKDNGGKALPSLAIHPVVRSDGSGTTAQFTLWMAKQYPSLWGPYNGGHATLTSQFPRKGAQIAASGSDQVMNTIVSAAGNGTIGYVEYAYPLNQHYPVVKVENKAGYYVAPTQYAVAVALTRAKINQQKGSLNYLTQDLSDVYTHPDPRAYPISSYSYMILPIGKDGDPNEHRMSTAKRQTLADFLTYSLCAGQAKAGAYGYSPLPVNLVQAGFSQVQQLHAADSAVDVTGRDITKCNNPTLDPKDRSKNALAEIAPQPLGCSKAGAVPCPSSCVFVGDKTSAGAACPSTVAASGGTAGAGGTGTGTGAGGTSGGTGGTPTAAGGAAPGAGAAPGTAGAGAVVDPATGQVVATGATGATDGSAATASPLELTSQRSGDNALFGTVAVLELVALVLAPGLYVAFLRRRRGTL